LAHASAALVMGDNDSMTIIHGESKPREFTRLAIQAGAHAGFS
jgi:hypothetical protein